MALTPFLVESISWHSHGRDLKQHKFMQLVANHYYGVKSQYLLETSGHLEISLHEISHSRNSAREAR